MNEAKPKRRWFTFGLRTLFVMVTLAAIGSWAYWVGWPWWMDYREQRQFEAAARQLKIQDNDVADERRLPPKVHDMWHNTGDKRFHYKIGKYIRTNVSYCIVFTFRKPAEPSAHFEPLKVSVYRVQHAPVDYRPYRDHAESIYAGSHSPAWVRDLEYINDFEDFILGDAEDGRPFQYELIYSDPPEKPIQ